jgi:hypothetical protein
MFASIEKHRTTAQVLLALIGISFIGFGASQFSFGSNNQYIVKIGDQIITRYQLDNAVRANRGATREAVFRQLMNRAYLTEGAKQLGLSISETELKQSIVNNKNFHDANGKFSTELFKQILASNGLSEQQFLESERETLLLESIGKILGSNVVADSQVAQFLNSTMAMRKIRNVGVNPQAFESKVKIDDASLKKFYDANQKSYTLPQAVQFEFVHFSPQTLAEKETVSDEEVKQAQQDVQNSSTNKREIAHILIPFGSNKDKAKEEAQKIAKEAQANPDKFAELAKKYSQDSDSKDKSGIIGEFSAQGNLVNDAFKKAAFGVESGGVSDVVESDFGYHIIRAKNLGNATASDDTAARDAAKLKKAQQTYTKLREELSAAAFDDSGSLKKAAEKLGLTVQTHSEWLTRDNAPAAKIPNAVVDALFSDDVFDKKHNSEAITVDGTTWFVRATQTRQQTVQAFDAVKERVKGDFVRSESARLATDEAKKILAELQAGKTLALNWSPVQEVSPEQAQGNFSPEAYANFMKTIPKNGKPAYVLIDNLGAPQLIEVQTVKQAAAADAETLSTVKQIMLPVTERNAMAEAFMDNLSKIVKTEQGSEKVTDATE